MDTLRRRSFPATQGFGLFLLVALTGLLAGFPLSARSAPAAAIYADGSWSGDGISGYFNFYFHAGGGDVSGFWGGSYSVEGATAKLTGSVWGTFEGGDGGAVGGGLEGEQVATVVTAGGVQTFTTNIRGRWSGTLRADGRGSGSFSASGPERGVNGTWHVSFSAEEFKAGLPAPTPTPRLTPTPTPRTPAPESTTPTPTPRTPTPTPRTPTPEPRTPTPVPDWLDRTKKKTESGKYDEAKKEWEKALNDLLYGLAGKDLQLVGGTPGNPQPSSDLLKLVEMALGKTFAPEDKGLSDEERQQIQIVNLVEAMKDQLKLKAEKAVPLLDSYSDDWYSKEMEKMRKSMTEKEWQDLVDQANKQNNVDIAKALWGMGAYSIGKQFGLDPTDAETARKVMEKAADKAMASGDLTALNNITDSLRVIGTMKSMETGGITVSVLDFSHDVANAYSVRWVLDKMEKERREKAGKPSAPVDKWLDDALKEGIHDYYSTKTMSPEELKLKRKGMSSIEARYWASYGGRP